MFSQFSFAGAIENGGQEGVEFSCGLGLKALQGDALHRG
jgi:hypothetical protein